MAGINFFSPYIQNTKRMKRNMNRLLFAALIFLLLAGGLIGVNFARLYMVKQEIKTLEAYLATPEMQEKKKQADATRLRMDIGSKYFKELENKEARIKAIDYLKVELMDTLTSTIPVGLIFKKLNVNVNIISITGEASSRRAVAELEYNLKKTGLFKSVIVLKISRDKGVGPFEYDLTAAFH